MSFIARFLHWEECSFDEYEKSCFRYGYNCESAPQFLSFMMSCGAPLKFYAYYNKSAIQASVCTDHGWLANDRKNKNRSINYLPVPASSILIPVNEKLQGKIAIPFRSKCVHPLQRGRFMNVSYDLFSKRKAAVAKDFFSDFSGKTISTREREIRHFLNAGGFFKPVADIESDSLFYIYNELYHSRRGVFINNKDEYISFFREFHHNIKGVVMYWKDEPVALQLLLAVDSHAGLFVDFINIGYDSRVPIKTPGTMLMWKNLSVLSDESRVRGKRLYYSYGFMSGEYKKRWCKPESLGRVLI